MSNSIAPVPPRRILCALALLAVLGALLGTGLTSRSAGDLQSQIAATRSAADSLKQQIAGDSQQIATTRNGIAGAQARLTAIQAKLDQRVAQLKAVQASLLAARDHLVQLENRLHLATEALAANLVAGYEGSQPNLTTVILNSHGFTDLLDQMSFMERIAHQNADIVGITRAARAEVARQATHLADLEARDRVLTNEVLAQRNQVAALRAALVRQQMSELSSRARATHRYDSLNAQLSHLQARLNAIEAAAAAAAARAATTGNANVGGIAVNTGGMVQPPAGAPEAIRQVIAAGNAIATLPYIWGGGHGSFHASGYDCSGSVSYALAAAGLISSPMVSGDFESYGDPGPGRWITIYANAGHVWMDVAGWRFDTVALSYGGTRWSQGGGEFSGFVVRHPPGL
ncbi:MAG TPA: hypothetical protein VG325_00605 [Solirubrobacteraceae bacterium]|nr:hypothetical protein [Solirubrobacteraceae bacterium]